MFLIYHKIKQNGNDLPGDWQGRGKSNNMARDKHQVERNLHDGMLRDLSIDLMTEII
jgi:hypothetical protein